MEPLLSEESSQDDLRVMSQQFALRIGPGGPSARVLPACAVRPFVRSPIATTL